MTAVVLASIVLTIPFLVAFIGIPLWMTFKRPDTGADHTGALERHPQRDADVRHQEGDRQQDAGQNHRGHVGHLSFRAGGCSAGLDMTQIISGASAVLLRNF